MVSFEQAVQPAQAPSVVPTSLMPPPPPPPDYQPPPTFQQSHAYSPPPVSPQLAASQPTIPVQITSEQVVGVILLRKPKSLGRYDSWTAILTGYRLIFAQMTSQMVNDAVTQARSQAKADGKGFFGQWGDQLKATFLYSQKYLSMEPNTVLAETPGNFALDNRGISEVKLKLKEISRGQDVEVHEFELEVSSAQGKYEFRMGEQNEFVNLLKQVYGERVKMPFGYFSHGVNVKLF
jgi:hypothetical protein